MRYNLICAQRLALLATVSALTMAGLISGTTTPALAEFEIKEAGVEKGEVELEYRGAVHWGFPRQEQAEEAGEVAEEEEEGEFLRQSQATTSSSPTASPSVGCSLRPSVPTSHSIKISM
jgi:hypothetical protein